MKKSRSKTDWLFVCLYRELFSKLGQTCHRSDECSSSGVSSSGSSGSNDQWRRFDLNEAFTFEPLSVSDLGEIYAEIEVFNNRNKQVLGKVSQIKYTHIYFITPDPTDIQYHSVSLMRNRNRIKNLNLFFHSQPT